MSLFRVFCCLLEERERESEKYSRDNTDFLILTKFPVQCWKKVPLYHCHMRFRLIIAVPSLKENFVKTNTLKIVRCTSIVVIGKF